MGNVWQTGEFMWKSCEWKGQLISTQSLLYITKANWQNLITSLFSGCRSLPCISTKCVEQIETVQMKSWNVSPRKAPSVINTRTRTCLTPNTQCHFAKKKTKKNAITVKPSIWSKLTPNLLKGRGGRRQIVIFKKITTFFLI